MPRPVRRLIWISALLALSAGHPVSAQSSDPLAAFLSDKGLVARAGPPWRDRAAAMVLDAMSFLDVPYRFGGNDAEVGFDCSGFTRHLFALNFGLTLPRRSHEQAAAAGLVPVGRQELQPGDLVFFNTLRRAFSHVGIYVGDGRFIHSPRPGAAVRIEDMDNRYWAPRFDGARRPALLADTRPIVAPPAAVLPALLDPEFRSGVGH